MKKLKYLIVLVIAVSCMNLLMGIALAADYEEPPSINITIPEDEEQPPGIDITIPEDGESPPGINIELPPADGDGDQGPPAAPEDPENPPPPEDPENSTPPEDPENPAPPADPRDSGSSRTPAIKIIDATAPPKAFKPLMHDTKLII